MTEQFLRKAIFIDFGAEIIYGSDEFFDTYPCRFPTVEFMLSSTDALVEVADMIRMGKGYFPMHPSSTSEISDLADAVSETILSVTFSTNGKAI